MELSNCKWFFLFLTGAAMLTYYTGNAYPIDNKYHHQKLLTDKFHKHLLKGIMNLNVTEFVIVGQRRMNNGEMEVFWSGGPTKNNQSERNTDKLMDIITTLMMQLPPGESSTKDIQNKGDVAASKTVLIPQETEKHELKRIQVAEIMSPQSETKPMPVSSALVRYKPEKSNNGETNINEKAIQEDSHLSSVYEVDIEEQYSPVYNENALSHAALNQTKSEEGNFKTSHILLWSLLLLYAVVVTIMNLIHYCIVSSPTKPKILSSNSDIITV